MHDDFDVATAARAEDISGKQLHARGERQDDVSYRRAVRRALMSFIWQRLGAIRLKDAAGDRQDLLVFVPKLLLQQRPFHAAVNDADLDTFARRARIAEEPLRSQ